MHELRLWKTLWLASPASRARICWLPKPTVGFAFSTPPLNPDSVIFFLLLFFLEERPTKRSVLCGAVGNPQSSEGFPSGCWNRGVCGAISKARWETCGKVASLRRQLSIKSSTGPAHVAASTELLAKLEFYPQILRKTHIYLYSDRKKRGRNHIPTLRSRGSGPRCRQGILARNHESVRIVPPTWP